MPDVMSIREVAAYLGLSPRTIRRIAAEGRLPCSRLVKGKLLFRRQAVEDALRQAEQPVGQVPGGDRP